jgi:hypothetical protein
MVFPILGSDRPCARALPAPTNREPILHARMDRLICLLQKCGQFGVSSTVLTDTVSDLE